MSRSAQRGDQPACLRLGARQRLTLIVGDDLSRRRRGLTLLGSGMLHRTTDHFGLCHAPNARQVADALRRLLTSSA